MSIVPKISLAAAALVFAAGNAHAGKSFGRKSGASAKPAIATSPKAPKAPAVAAKPAPKPKRVAPPPPPPPPPPVEVTVVEEPPPPPAPPPVIAMPVAAIDPPVAPIAIEPEPEPTPALEPEPAPEPEPIASITQSAPAPVEHIHYGANLQTWICVDTAENCASVAGLGDATYRIRRAELSVKGDVTDHITYAVMIDPAKTLEPQMTTVGTVTVKQPVSALSALQDLYVTYVTAYADVQTGQFKIPVSWEGSNSSTKLLFPERAAVSLKYGDKRDLGVRVTKTIGRFMYSAGIYDGQSANNLDANDQKDAALRVEVTPIDGLMIGAVTYDSLFQRELAGTKDRWEGDLRFERYGVIVQAEAIAGRDVVTRGMPAVTSYGAYAALAYTLPGHVQPALRVGYVDPDRDKPSDGIRQYDAGVDYYLKGQNAKLQAVFTTFDFAAKPTERQIIAAAQVSF